jgi:hypothetical protein
MLPRNPVCVKCQKTLKPYHNGAYLVELYAQNQSIYKIWSCDIWACPKCGVKIVCGFGDNPILTNMAGEEHNRKFIKNIEDTESKEWIIYDYE